MAETWNKFGHTIENYMEGKCKLTILGTAQETINILVKEESVFKFGDNSVLSKISPRMLKKYLSTTGNGYMWLNNHELQFFLSNHKKFNQ